MTYSHHALLLLKEVKKNLVSLLIYTNVSKRNATNWFLWKVAMSSEGGLRWTPIGAFSSFTEISTRQVEKVIKGEEGKEQMDLLRLQRQSTPVTSWKYGSFDSI